MEKEVIFSFPKEEKLSKKGEFCKVFDNGKSLGGRTLALYFILKESGFPRAGFIASKKVSKRAVDRNRGKRLLREVFRLNKHKLLPCDIVLIARRGILSAGYEDVERDFLNLLKKAGLLRNG